MNVRQRLRPSPKVRRWVRTALRIALGFVLLVAVAVCSSPAAASSAGVSYASMPALAMTERALVRMARPRRRRVAPELNQASASYSRYSSDGQDAITIESQQLACRQRAETDRQPISASLEYKDEAISGATRERAGLNRLLADAERGLFNRLYVLSLSRWSRETGIGMPMLKRLVNVYKIRVISVTEGFDTINEGWEQLAQNLLMQHERYIKELSKNAFRGQATNCDRGYSNGDYCFGYTSEPADGEAVGRRNRRTPIRMIYAIDPVTSEWVKRIFYWFVVERRSIRWIVAELNAQHAPKDHRSDTPTWWHHNVVRILSNRKYVGDWPWAQAKNMRDPETGDLYREPRPDDEIEKYRRILPELRLIDDETFAQAQQILAENKQKHGGGRDEDGKFVEDREGASTRCDSHLLSGLVRCGGCGRRFYVGGAAARYLVCPGYIQGVCSYKTQLNRARAERLILEQISARLLADEEWVQAVLAQTHAAWSHRQATLPGEIGNLRTALAEIERRIARLVDSVEGEREPDPDIRRRLNERRAERRTLREQLEAAEAKQRQQPTEPTEAWVREKLSSLVEVLHHATPAAHFALEALIGGSIVVTEVSEPGKVRRYYRGLLRLSMGSTIAKLESGVDASVTQEVEEIVIDFRDGADHAFDAECERVWALKQSGLRICDIAEEMKLTRTQVNVRLHRAAQRHGEQLPGENHELDRPSDPPHDEAA